MNDEQITDTTTFGQLDQLLEGEGLSLRSVAKLRRSTGFTAIVEYDPTDAHAGSGKTPSDAITSALTAARMARRFDKAIRKAAHR